MKNSPLDYQQIAEGLLTKAAQFDQHHLDSAVDDGEYARIEVLRDFVEQRLGEKISEEQAAGINRLATHSHNIDADEIAPTLSRLLNKASP